MTRASGTGHRENNLSVEKQEDENHKTTAIRISLIAKSRNTT
jgi:hypothetical protein